MQQVAARNCLHGAASGARAGVSVLEELFWNAAARSDAVCSEFCFGSVLFAWIVRACRRALALDCVAGCVMHGRTLMCTVFIARSDPRRTEDSIRQLSCLCASTRFLTKVLVRGAPGVAVSVKVCSRPRRRRSC